jgi:hypothetical protein
MNNSKISGVGADPVGRAAAFAPRKTAVIALSLLAALLFILYWSGLHGPFLHDDDANIVGNEPLHLTTLGLTPLWHAALAGQGGGLGRPISLLSFAVNHWLSGLVPFPYKLTNLLIHILNSVLLALFLRQLFTRSPGLKSECPGWGQGIALGATMIWAVLPLHVSTVLYVVQRMTLLSATFSLAALLAYTGGRLRQEQGEGGWPLILSSFLLWLPLSVLSKENGILTLAYIWCVEWFALRPRADVPASVWGRHFRYSLLVLGLCGVAYLLRFTALQNADVLLKRGFDLSQRTLTEGRVLWWYVGQIYWPRIGDMGLVHDTWTVSKGFWAPLQTGFSWLAWIALAISAFVLRRRAPLWGFAVLWFMLGHALEAGPLPLELVYEHRNYLPAVGLVLLPALGFLHWAGPSHKAGRAVICVAGAVVLAVMATLTGQRANDWSSALRWTATNLKHHPDSHYANSAMADLYARMMHDDPDPAQRIRWGQTAGKLYTEAIKLKPYELQPLVGYIGLRNQAGQFQNDALYEGVASLASRPPMGTNNFNALIGLITCAASGACPVTEIQLQKIVKAALANPGCDPARQSLLLQATGNYYGAARKNPRLAATYLQRAVDLAGRNLNNRLLLAQWLAIAGDSAAALTALDKLSAKDRYGEYTEVADALRRQIQSRASVEASAPAQKEIHTPDLLRRPSP